MASGLGGLTFAGVDVHQRKKLFSRSAQVPTTAWVAFTVLGKFAGLPVARCPWEGQTRPVDVLVEGLCYRPGRSAKRTRYATRLSLSTKRNTPFSQE